MPTDINPLEQLTEEMSDYYVELVYSLTETLAPMRPWWSSKLSADQQLWRWTSAETEEGGLVRDAIIGWLMTAGAYMGWKSAEEVMAHIEDIFTKPEATDVIPPAHVAEIPAELLEIVQAGGPKDAGNHIRKMERMVKERLGVLAVLRNTDQPDVPETPAPQPVELTPGTGGWPLYGNVPIQPQRAFGAPAGAS